MKFPVLSLLIASVAVSYSDIGHACRVPQRQVAPLTEEYDAAALATVKEADEHIAKIEIGEILHGTVKQREFPLFLAGYSSTNGAGTPLVIISSCGPGGPPVETDDVIVVYFKGDQIRRWARAEELVSIDPHVQAVFLNAFSSSDTAVKKRRNRRADLVLEHKGPVPESDPTRWVEPFDGNLAWAIEGSDITRVRFAVNPDGSIDYCQVVVPHRETDRDKSICEMLDKNASFRPPLLSQELEGWYEVRWSQMQTED